nr:MAG TPA: hypothetical protein [Caudoviricetes sp.]
MDNHRLDDFDDILGYCMALVFCCIIKPAGLWSSLRSNVIWYLQGRGNISASTCSPALSQEGK